MSAKCLKDFRVAFVMLRLGFGGEPPRPQFLKKSEALAAWQTGAVDKKLSHKKVGFCCAGSQEGRFLGSLMSMIHIP